MKFDPAAARIAIKTCLAFGIALAAALYLDWEVTPAVITTQMLQAALLGISVRNSITRFVGACVSGFICLVMFGLFPQDRFMLILMYGLVVSFAVYMFQGSKNPYLWLIVAAIIPINGLAVGGNPPLVFNQSVSVCSSFLLGGAAVILVNELLWPNPITRVFEGDLAKTLQGIKQQFGLSRAALVDGDAPHAADEQKVQGELIKAATMLPTLVRNAAVESRQIERFQNNYIRLMDDVTVMGAEVIALGDLLAACLGSETLGPQLAGSEAFQEDLDRFDAELESLAGQVKAERDGSLQMDTVPAPALSAGPDTSAPGDPDRALLEALRAKAGETWSLIGAVRQALANVENPHVPQVGDLEPPKKEPFSFTSFRFRWAVFVGFISFMGGYLWLLTQWPQGFRITLLAPVFGCTMIHPWQGQKKAVVTGILLGIGVSWILYFVALPPLPDDFWFLWLTMMVFFFPLVYLQAIKNPFWAQAGFFGGFVFCMTVSVSHFQHYDFSSYISVVTGVLGGSCYGLAVLSLVQHKPAERQFRKAVEAFLVLCGKILREFEDQIVEPDAISKLRTRRRALIGAYQVCAGFLDRLPYKRVPQNTQEKVVALLASLWSITFRLDAMNREHCRRVQEGTLDEGKGAELRQTIAHELGSLSLAVDRSETVNDRWAHLDRGTLETGLQGRVHSAVNAPPGASGLLASEGFHAALQAAVGNARRRFKALDWRGWDEERF